MLAEDFMRLKGMLSKTQSGDDAMLIISFNPLTDALTFVHAVVFLGMVET